MKNFQKLCSDRNGLGNIWISPGTRRLSLSPTSSGLGHGNRIWHNWNRMHEIFRDDSIVIVTILDPRLKMAAIEPGKQNRANELLSHALESIQNDETSQLAASSVNDDSIFRGTFVTEGPSELASYLAAPREVKNCDPILYWKSNSKLYPGLSNLARRVLCIQSTSVASERCFSTASELDTNRCNRLSSESFRANVLLKSWLKFLSLV